MTSTTAMRGPRPRPCSDPAASRLVTSYCTRGVLHAPSPPAPLPHPNLSRAGTDPGGAGGPGVRSALPPAITSLLAIVPHSQRQGGLGGPNSPSPRPGHLAGAFLSLRPSRQPPRLAGAPGFSGPLCPHPSAPPHRPPSASTFPKAPSCPPRVSLRRAGQRSPGAPCLTTEDTGSESHIGLKVEAAAPARPRSRGQGVMLSFLPPSVPWGPSWGCRGCLAGVSGEGQCPGLTEAASERVHVCVRGEIRQGTRGCRWWGAAALPSRPQQGSPLPPCIYFLKPFFSE